MYGKLTVTLLSILAFSLAGCAAKTTVKGGSVEVHSEKIHAKVIFTDDDRVKIFNYYEKKDKHKKMPPGLAKKEELPPGLQKHIVKHGELPPGLQGRRLPDELDRTLSSLPDGFIRLKVGVDVVLLDEKTRVVADVIWGVDL